MREPGHEIMRRLVLAPCRAALTSIDIDIQTLTPLACGYWGCAFRIDGGRHEGLVVKITADKAEAYMAEYLRASRDVPRMLPQIEAVYRLKCAEREEWFRRMPQWPGRSPYLILREDLDDVPAGELSDARVIMHAVSNAVHLIWDSYEIRWRGSTLNERNAVALTAWAVQRRAKFGDIIGTRNWGWRAKTKELVIRDVGTSQSPEQKDPAALEGTRGR